jgi:glycosyltransferase involved in cell wall biosynthesis
VSDRVSVLLLTEGTYPLHGGGVSTWCDELCTSLDSVDFHVFALTGTPGAEPRYEIPDNVRELRTLPLWSNKEPALWYQPHTSFSDVYLRRGATTPAVIERDFIPPFRALLGHILRPDEPVAPAAGVLAALHRYFQRHDYLETFRSEMAWKAYRRALEDGPDPVAEGIGLRESTVTLRWLANLLLPLSASLPETDCIHTTASGLCALPGIAASHIRGTPLVVTDHGVYARERYLALAQEGLPPFSRSLLARLSLFVARLCYAVADQISPVCRYNRRWEEALGADPGTIETIHNGIRAERFRPGPKPAATRGRPTVVALAHVYPLKDIETMIRSCHVARREVPDVEYRVYGSVEREPGYTARCRSLIAELGLEDHFRLRGYGARPAELYREGDLSVLSSISEGFPYAVLESMACERPVVATDVGGVTEAVGDCGVVVRPRDHEALGREVARLLLDDERRVEMGRRARQRVLDHFQLSRCISRYESSYRRLARGRRATGRPVQSGRRVRPRTPVALSQPSRA